MFEITIMIFASISILILKFALNIDFKQFKNMENLELIDLNDKLEDDEKICKKILKKLNNDKVKIKIDKNYKNCLYLVFNNTIYIGEFQQNYIKPQTIAHECIHSCQNRVTLWTNFIISNIYLLYFMVVVILGIFNISSNIEIWILGLIFLSVIQYIIRYSLEYEAMLKARYLACEYLKNDSKLEENDITRLLNEYDKINSKGIPFMNFYLISINIIKVLICCFVALI